MIQGCCPHVDYDLWVKDSVIEFVLTGMVDVEGPGGVDATIEELVPTNVLLVCEHWLDGGRVGIILVINWVLAVAWVEPLPNQL